ncbi:hypothetical protein Pelo_5026 [Pelomyxa schiedti]|nr:hypothetical protein Pelo_5026 [Pelomyxa schiedti]
MGAEGGAVRPRGERAGSLEDHKAGAYAPPPPLHCPNRAAPRARNLNGGNARTGGATAVGHIMPSHRLCGTQLEGAAGGASWMPTTILRHWPYPRSSQQRVFWCDYRLSSEQERLGLSFIILTHLLTGELRDFYTTLPNNGSEPWFLFWKKTTHENSQLFLKPMIVPSQALTLSGRTLPNDSGNKDLHIEFTLIQTGEMAPCPRFSFDAVAEITIMPHFEYPGSI